MSHTFHVRILQKFSQLARTIERCLSFSPRKVARQRGAGSLLFVMMARQKLFRPKIHFVLAQKKWLKLSNFAAVDSNRMKRKCFCHNSVAKIGTNSYILSLSEVIGSTFHLMVFQRIRGSRWCRWRKLRACQKMLMLRFLFLGGWL